MKYIAIKLNYLLTIAAKVMDRQDNEVAVLEISLKLVVNLKRK